VEKYLTAYELAALLNLSVETVWRYTREKKIPVLKLGAKKYRYRKEEVLAALAAGGDLAKEEQAFYGKQGAFTYEDYLQLPEEPGFRYEILDGFLLKEPSPSVSHQRASRELGYQLKTYFDQFDPAGEIFNAPLDVTLGDRNVVQPDILFISGAHREIIRPDRIDGPCDLVVEIMSPTNRRKDRLKKMEIYRRAGIPHYWLVDPEEKTLEAFFLQGENYALVFAGGPEDEFAHPAFPGLKLELEKVFYHPDAERAD